MKENIIRKISVGSGYPDQCLHFLLGKTYKFSGKYFEVSEIRYYTELGIKCYEVVLKDEFGKVHWKKIEGMPVVVEYMIDFD